MPDIQQRIHQELQALKTVGLLRQRHLFRKTGNQSVNFCSNDYLSLTNHPKIKAAYQDAYQNNLTGSGGSMVLGGYHPAHQQLERAFSDFLSVDSAILFSSGYTANLALMLLAKKLDLHCFIDKRIHASVYDGLALSRADYSRFRHNDEEQLCQKINHCDESLLIMTEGIFSMTGQMASLSKVKKELSEKQFIWLDEAHSFGVVGEQGRGVANHYQFNQQQLPLRIIPLGKSCAAQGAIVAGKAEWVELLLQTGRSYIYSTAMSPAIAKGVLVTLELIEQADERREKLQQLSVYFTEKKNASAFNWLETGTAIQYLKLSSNHQALLLHQRLEEEGIHCFAVRPPTVPANESGIRFVLNYDHQAEDIDRLFTSLEKVQHEYQL